MVPNVNPSISSVAVANTFPAFTRAAQLASASQGALTKGDRDGFLPVYAVHLVFGIFLLAKLFFFQNCIFTTESKVYLGHYLLGFSEGSQVHKERGIFPKLTST